MRFLQFDSVGGASGDMLLGALAAVGADLPAIAATLQAWLPEPVTVHTGHASDRGLHGVRVTVRGGALAHAQEGAIQKGATLGVWHDAAGPADPGHDHAAPAAIDEPHPHRGGHHAGAAPVRPPHTHAPHRDLAAVTALLAAAPVPAGVRHLAERVFRRLAEAEAQVHGTTPEQVHFHEVGATDALVDVVGCCLALDQLHIDGVRVGPLPCGTGTLRCAHGVMPNPAPATLRLLAGFELEATDEPFELVTPTGAALLATWRAQLLAPPARLRLVTSGFGFGQRALHGRPNVLRASLYECVPPSLPADAGEVLVLETNLDDCNPQWLGAVVGQALEAGALDAWITPVTMKKGRPGMVLSILCARDRVAGLRELVFRSTPTFGIRQYAVERTVLDRHIVSVPTRYGEVRVKVGARAGEVSVRTPEFADCERLARAHGVAPRQIAEAAAVAWEADRARHRL